MTSTTRRQNRRSDSRQEEFLWNSSVPMRSGQTLAALDLFAGIGGLSSGFAEVGFQVTGVDSEALAAEVYRNSHFGTARVLDLAVDLCLLNVPVVMGGPPCRPWSPVNLQRRRGRHGDHALLGRFVENVRAIRPAIFIMENVPALGSDPLYAEGMGLLRGDGYSIDARVLHYDDFGAATRRRRLFTVGVLGAAEGARTLFRYLEDERRPPTTVGQAILRFRDTERGEVPDHEWSELESIGNYRDRYSTGQYGWRKLEYDRAAPSFGSVSKTYILHPEAGANGYPERVLSVREVMSIMGFSDDVCFPAGTPLGKRYQMVANTVSPQVSRAVAVAVKRLLSPADSHTHP